MMLLGVIRRRHELAAQPRDDDGRPMSMREQLLARIKARKGG